MASARQSHTLCERALAPIKQRLLQDNATSRLVFTLTIKLQMHNLHRNNPMDRAVSQIMGNLGFFTLKKAPIALKSLCAAYSGEFLNIYARAAKLGR
ncbi:hypothetical protein [Reinekea sp. G2M2-21]|uniref:hypothetical protein n=1 Tax=Reinekea sp. G2M2-21 TaxID=2788942 RepID=UPI0018A97CF2|nr:hypothetical protein [Reinekea sp. G2M2-21]